MFCGVKPKLPFLGLPLMSNICLVSCSFWSLFTAPLLFFFFFFRQHFLINYLHVYPHLRVCFWWVPLKTRWYSLTLLSAFWVKHRVVLPGLLLLGNSQVVGSGRGNGCYLWSEHCNPGIKPFRALLWWPQMLQSVAILLVWEKYQ